MSHLREDSKPVNSKGRRSIRHKIKSLMTHLSSVLANKLVFGKSSCSPWT